MRFLLIFSFFLFSCSETYKNNFSLVFDIKKVDTENNTSVINFILSNNSNYSIHSKNWSIFWSQMYGDIDNNSLPEGVTFESINGDYRKLNFKDFQLKKNSSIEFEFLMNGFWERLVLGPQGVFIRDDLRDTTYDVDTEIKWRAAEGIEKLNLPNSKSRYNNNKLTKHLHKNMIGDIIPTPKSIKKISGKYELKDTFNISFNDDEFTDVINLYLKNSNEFLGIKHNKNVEDYDILLTKNESFSDEEYTLNIIDEEIKINFADKSGLSYALNSLFQLFINAKIERSDFISNYQIHDVPRFKYRGIHLDISRNYYGPNKIKQLLDFMHYFKLNKFHLNITDDEGWRIEIPGLPELTDVGSKRGYTSDERDHLNPAYGSGSKTNMLFGSGYLKKSEFIEIIKYANERNIEIIPEINFPAHSRAAVKAMESRYFKYIELNDSNKAEEYLLSDLNDQSSYISAQGYNDNVISICKENSFRFFKKVIDELDFMFEDAGVKLKNFHLGGDELPYGAWIGSPICQEFVNDNNTITFNNLVENAFRRVIELLNNRNVNVSGWEDVLLVHGEDEQNSIDINRNFDGINFTPYVWNNYWGGGREDMVYKFANLGYNVIMSNSSAFYFDMTDDLDPENYGLSWSGYVNYKDSWLTEPLNVYSKTYLESDFKRFKNPKSVSIDKKKESNFLGIQGQLWTETVRNEKIFDELMYPNLIVLAEKAWSQQDQWTKNLSIQSIDEMMSKEWSYFANTLGHKTLNHLSLLYGGIDFDLPKPGGIIKNDTLFVNSVFPGTDVRFTRDGSKPSSDDELYTKEIKVLSSELIVLRSFDKTGRGGRDIVVSR